MRQRTPVFINIFIVLLIIVVIFALVMQNYTFINNPIFYGVLLIAVILTLIVNAIGDLLEITNFKKLTAEEKEQYIIDKKTPYWLRVKNSAFKKQDERTEEELIIDHGFDGITELDNALPRWWVGMFYILAGYCVIYLFSYAFTDFAHPYKEYDEEYTQKQQAIDAYIATLPPVTVENAIYSEDFIAEGKKLFIEICATCHSADGSGGIGPNLTDGYWINTPEDELFKDIFYMIWNGSKNNPAMRPFGADGEILGRDIEKIASYVYHINQEPTITPAQGGAAPQGIIPPWGAKNN